MKNNVWQMKEKKTIKREKQKLVQCERDNMYSILQLV